MGWFTQARRAYIYRVLTALGPAAVFYGLLSGAEVALWLGIGGTVLQTGATALAAANTPTKPADAEAVER